MTYRKHARTTANRIFGIVLAGMLLIIVTRSYRLLVPTASFIDIPGTEQAQPQLPLQQAEGKNTTSTDVPQGDQPHSQRAPSEGVPPGTIPRLEPRSVAGEADGAVGDDTTVFDDEIPGVAKLDPALLVALRQAASAAAEDGLTFFVTSGWRSPAYQNQLLREAVVTYGSEAEAARWVATADTSPHVSGSAVDIGPTDAALWLSDHGAEYELCQIYRNEPWHYELRPGAREHGCPPMYADPTHDPRMQR